MNQIDKKLLIITGPTATGKSAVALEIGRIIGGEIISADSMQVYRGMDIGTAKPSLLELSLVPHHLINVCDPDFPYSVAVFQEMAKKAINNIISRGKMPIITGGTGFYLNGLIRNNNYAAGFSGKLDYTYRNQLYALAVEKGNMYIHNILYQIDKESADAIHPNNVKRVVRALEFYRETGVKMSEHNKTEKAKGSAYNYNMFILTMDREKLYQRINSRVDAMISAGLVDEVKALMSKGATKNLVSMQGLGYKEIVGFLEGQYGLPEAVELLKKRTRNFAKRQNTWFKNQCDGRWLDVLGYESVKNLAEDIIRMITEDDGNERQY